MPPHLSRPILGALHTHVAGWAGFVAVVAQGWAGLNQTSGRRGPLSLRAPYIVHLIVHFMVHYMVGFMVRSMVHYTVHSAAALSAFRALPRLASPGHPHPHAHPPPSLPPQAPTPTRRLAARSDAGPPPHRQGRRGACGGPRRRRAARARVRRRRAREQTRRRRRVRLHPCAGARDHLCALSLHCASLHPLCALSAPSPAAPSTPPAQLPTHPPACPSPSPSPASSFLTLTPVHRRPARTPPAARTAAALQLPTRAAAVPAGGLRHRRARARGAHTDALSVHERGVSARTDRAALARADLLFEDGGRGLNRAWVT